VSSSLTVVEATRRDMMERHEFEQRLIEGVGDEIARIATAHFGEMLTRGDGVVFDIRDEGTVKLIAVDHFDEGGLLITIEAEDASRYLVRFEIGRGHIAIEAVPLDA
jgi:hypothetical protein